MTLEAAGECLWGILGCAMLAWASWNSQERSPHYHCLRLPHLPESGARVDQPLRQNMEGGQDARVL